MNYGYSTNGRPAVVHKTKTSTPLFGGNKKFLPECDRKLPKAKQRGEINGQVVSGVELTIRCNTKGLKVNKCDKCFGMFDAW